MSSRWTITEIEDGLPVASVKGVSREDAVAAIYRAMRGEDPLPTAAKREALQLQAERREQIAAAA
jgi:hypothetical protein